MTDPADSAICDLDWEAEGKTSGHFILPGPDGQLVHIPVLRLKSGDGPSLYLNAGTHGDEFEGQIALRDLWQELSADQIKGTLTITPSLNIPAMLANQRRTPIEETDLNRSFPGRPDGSFAERLADLISRTCVQNADAVMDLHAAGSHISLKPMVLMHSPESYRTIESYRASIDAAEAFGADFILHADEPDNNGMLDTYVEGLGKPFVCFELGSAAATTPETLEKTRKGLWRLLAHFSLIEQLPQAVEPAQQNRHMEGILESIAIAPHEGLYEPVKLCGEAVEEGELIGRLYPCEDVEAEPIDYHAVAAGIKILQRSGTRVQPNDILFGLAKARAYP